MIDKLSDDMKKLFLLGIGAAAVTAAKAERAHGIGIILVEKGELSIEQGKVLNEELKHHIQTRVDEAKSERAAQRMEQLSSQIRSMSDEELEQLKEVIREVQSGPDDEA